MPGIIHSHQELINTIATLRGAIEVAESLLAASNLPTEFPEEDIEMRLIRPPSGGSYLSLDEKRLTPMKEAYWIAKYPVTNRLWTWVMGEKPPYGYSHPQAPVTGVSLEKSLEFCERLSRLRGLDGSSRAFAPFRLPTNNEWEWACLGGVRCEQAAGPQHGWLIENSGGTTHRVGELEANSNGIHDMLGNVWERTAGGDLRGGGFQNNSYCARASFSLLADGAYTNVDVGFRLAR